MMISSFTFRTSLFLLLVMGSVGLIGSCKNPTAPREPNKFASQATFIRQLDSIRVNNSTILLSGGVARNALSLPSGDLLFVGEVQRPGSLFRSALVIRTNALGGVRWANLYTDSIETLRSIVPVSNGEFIAMGSIFSGDGQTRGYAFKIDSLGNQVWSRVFKNSRFSGGSRLSNGNVLLFGQTRRVISVQPSRFVDDGDLSLIDLNGNILSEQNIRSLGSQRNIPNTPIAFNSSIAMTAEVVLAGLYTPFFDFVKGGFQRVLAPDLYLLRLNASSDTTGSFIFDAQYPAGDVLDESVSFAGKLNTSDEALSIFQLPDGNFAVYARTNLQFYILILNSSLSAVVQRIIPPDISSLSPSMMSVTLDGNFIFVGTSTQKITFDGRRSPAPGGTDVYIAKYSSQGNLLWEITQGTPLVDAGLNIVPTVDGGYVITGTSNDKPLLLKVDERGLLAE